MSQNAYSAEVPSVNYLPKPNFFLKKKREFEDQKRQETMQAVTQPTKTSGFSLEFKRTCILG